ncbi:hypothetical protein PT974_01041 [Cladobotryum mycophilum]|uniref:Zn(2)-C6 fungal-type domain-containing protein n=1 Tax=Cladobotryum mycophilum TaxID=491253 RepID=A0ABR0T364_9HYPO
MDGNPGGSGDCVIAIDKSKEKRHPVKRNPKGHAIPNRYRGAPRSGTAAAAAGPSSDSQRIATNARARAPPARTRARSTRTRATTASTSNNGGDVQMGGVDDSPSIARSTRASRAANRAMRGATPAPTASRANNGTPAVRGRRYRGALQRPRGRQGKSTAPDDDDDDDNDDDDDDDDDDEEEEEDVEPVSTGKRRRSPVLSDDEDDNNASKKPRRIIKIKRKAPAPPEGEDEDNDENNRPVYKAIQRGRVLSKDEVDNANASKPPARKKNGKKIAPVPSDDDASSVDYVGTGETTDADSGNDDSEDGDTTEDENGLAEGEDEDMMDVDDQPTPSSAPRRRRPPAMKQPKAIHAFALKQPKTAAPVADDGENDGDIELDDAPEPEPEPVSEPVPGPSNRKRKQDDLDERLPAPAPKKQDLNRVCKFCQQMADSGIVDPNLTACDAKRLGSGAFIECTNCANHRSGFKPGHVCELPRAKKTWRKYGSRDSIMYWPGACEKCIRDGTARSCDVDPILRYACTNCKSEKCHANGVPMDERPTTVPGVRRWFRRECDVCVTRSRDESDRGCTWLNDRTTWDKPCHHCTTNDLSCFDGGILIAHPASLRLPKDWVIPPQLLPNGFAELSDTTEWRKPCLRCVADGHTCKADAAAAGYACERCTQLGIDCEREEDDEREGEDEGEEQRKDKGKGKAVDKGKGKAIAKRRVVYPIFNLTRVGMGSFQPFQACGRCVEKGRNCDHQRPCDSCCSNSDKKKCDSFTRSTRKGFNCINGRIQPAPPALYYLAMGYGAKGVNDVKDGTKLEHWIGPAAPMYAMKMDKHNSEAIAVLGMQLRERLQPRGEPPNTYKRSVIQGVIPSDITQAQKLRFRHQEHAGETGARRRQCQQSSQRRPPERQHHPVLGLPHPDQSPLAGLYGPRHSPGLPYYHTNPVSRQEVIDVDGDEDMYRDNGVSWISQNPFGAAEYNPPPGTEISMFPNSSMIVLDNDEPSLTGDFDNMDIDDPAGFFSPAQPAPRMSTNVAAYASTVAVARPGPLAIFTPPALASASTSTAVAGPAPRNYSPVSDGSNPSPRLPPPNPFQFTLYGMIQGLQVVPPAFKNILEPIPEMPRTPRGPGITKCREVTHTGGRKVHCGAPISADSVCQCRDHSKSRGVCDLCNRISREHLVAEDGLGISTKDILSLRAYLCTDCSHKVSADMGSISQFKKTGINVVRGQTVRQPQISGPVKLPNGIIDFKGNALPITGCACGTKLFEQRMCRNHRKDFARRILDRAKEMRAWRLQRFGRHACPGCLINKSAIESNLCADEAGRLNSNGHKAWACLVCSELVIHQETSPKLVKGWKEWFFVTPDSWN